MPGGYMGKIANVDLASAKVTIEDFDEGMARQFIGGYGLGVRLLFEKQKKGADPLGPQNILGFTTGPLTGTKAPTGSRYMAVCKSPLTDGWGDANSGGYFGSELKATGLDAVFIAGKSAAPKYLHITDNRIEIRDASHLWGKDTVETEREIRKEHGDSKTRIACIGPASERLSLISGIINDGGRAAARSGVGAVMGSKQLKAVVVRGSQKPDIADSQELDRLRKAFLKEMRDMPGFPQALMKLGTCGFTEALVSGGATPIKNWQLSGMQAYPNGKRICDGQAYRRYQQRKYACANCPIACGGICEVSDGKYPIGETHKPEYETIGAFGPLCLNTDIESIFKLNDMCNRSGLDTISAGTVIAFAMECFENGILKESDTDGIVLTWGNSQAMVTVLEKIIIREGFGDILADGVRVAAQKIGGEAQKVAMHVGGQEPGLHNALFLPSRATGFVCDPTPGRHTAAPMARIDGGPGMFAPYPELKFDQFDRYAFTGKGAMSAKASCYLQVGNCAGVCLMPMMFFGNYPLIEFLNAVTGWTLDIHEVLDTGARIQTLRQCYNIREGIDPSQISLPDRLIGRPAMSEGPLAGVTIDAKRLAGEYRHAMGWDPENGRPQEQVLNRLGLNHVLETCQ